MRSLDADRDTGIPEGPTNADSAEIAPSPPRRSFASGRRMHLAPALASAPVGSRVHAGGWRSIHPDAARRLSGRSAHTGGMKTGRPSLRYCNARLWQRSPLNPTSTSFTPSTPPAATRSQRTPPQWCTDPHGIDTVALASGTRTPPAHAQPPSGHHGRETARNTGSPPCRACKRVLPPSTHQSHLQHAFPPRFATGARIGTPFFPGMLWMRPCFRLRSLTDARRDWTKLDRQRITTLGSLHKPVCSTQGTWRH
jgi:hypothetical protein